MEQPKYYEDVIDLGKYLEALLRQWRIILITTIIFTLVSYLSTRSKPTTFQAQALIATTRTSSDVSLGTFIDTTSESDLNAYRFVDQKARVNSFIELINNPVVAEDVIYDLGDQLNGNLKDPRVITKIVSGEILPSTDTIAIHVSHSDPVLAAAIANAWTKAYVKYINTLYSEGNLGDSFLAIQEQINSSKSEYDTAQQVYATFQEENKVAELTRQITERQTLVDNLSTSRITDLSTQIDEALQEARRVDRLILDAQGMLDQINSGGSNAVDSNSLALMLLKNQAFAANESFTNLTIQTAPVTMTPQAMTNDIQGLISALQDRKELLDEKIITLSDQLFIKQNSSQEGVLQTSIKNKQLEQTITQLEEEVRILQAQLTEQQSMEQDLNRAVELTWNTYTNIATKAAELGIAAETSGTEVALAVPATIPLSPESRVDTRMILITGAAGFIIGVLLAFIIEFWWGYKGIEPQPITVKYLVRETKKYFSSYKDN